MGEGLSHWSNMVLRKSQTYFFDRHTHPNSMYSNFCHVLKPGLELSWLWGKRFLLGFLFICQIVNTKSQDLGLNPEPMETTHISIHLPDIHG